MTDKRLHDRTVVDEVEGGEEAQAASSKRNDRRHSSTVEEAGCPQQSACQDGKLLSKKKNENRPITTHTENEMHFPEELRPLIWLPGGGYLSQ